MAENIQEMDNIKSSENALIAKGSCKKIPSGNAVEGEMPMTVITAEKAQKRMNALLSEVSDSHEPIIITGRKKNGVLVSEEDWRSIRETLYLCSIPGMRESIIKGGKTPVEKCFKDPGW